MMQEAMSAEETSADGRPHGPPRKNGELPMHVRAIFQHFERSGIYLA